MDENWTPLTAMFGSVVSAAGISMFFNFLSTIGYGIWLLVGILMTIFGTTLSYAMLKKLP